MSQEFAGIQKNAGADMADWFFDNGLDIFVVLRDWGVERINPAWAELTGWPVKETIGRTLKHFGHPEDEAVVLEATRTMQSQRSAEAEFRIRTQDGRWLWMSSRMRMTDAGDVMAVLRDVTGERARRLEAEHAAKSTELLRAAAGIYMWAFNPDTGKYTVEAEAASGEAMSVEDVSGVQMTQNIHPEDREPFGKVFFGAIKTGEAGHYGYRYLRPDGAYARYLTAWRGVRQCDGGKWEIRGLTQDITELADARDAAIQGEIAAKAAAEIKSQFLANMSHEIRTPLNGVLGVLQLLETEALTAEGRGLLTEAVSCGAMLAELVNDLLDFSNIEAGLLELQTAPVDIAAVFDGVTAMMRPQIEAKGLTFQTEMATGAGWVQTDPLRLRQVLFNLVGNAMKFTAQGGVTVRMKIRDQGESRRLRFEISDTGIGMSEETQASLFRIFHQADGSATRKFGGTGLGLAITRTLTELMGGQVGVHSVEGRGSTFWIDLPAPEIAAPEAVTEEEGGWLEGLKILVVEDNPTNRLIATKMLETLGAFVETAENGALGVEAMQTRAFDLVFMDIQMPVMDGMTATTAIRALPAPACQAPIIAVTANAMPHQQAEYKRIGMNGLIAKPLSPSAIIAEIAKLAA